MEYAWYVQHVRPNVNFQLNIQFNWSVVTFSWQLGADENSMNDIENIAFLLASCAPDLFFARN